MKRHCLEKCDEEGKKGDYSTTTNQNVSAEDATKANEFASSSSNNAGTATGSSNNDSKSNLGTSTTPLSSAVTVASAVPPMVAECEAELDVIIATMESVLSPLWAESVEGVSAGIKKSAAVLVRLTIVGVQRRRHHKRYIDH